MSRVVVLGAGIAGHTAAAFARKWLGSEHTVTVVSPRPDYNWVPSNIWVGVGLMKPAQVTIPLAPVYERAGIEFVQAAAREIHPDGDRDHPTPYVVVEPDGGATARLSYDFLLNATGPELRFDKTEGLGPDGGHSLSVCLPGHAAARHFHFFFEQQFRAAASVVVFLGLVARMAGLRGGHSQFDPGPPTDESPWTTDLLSMRRASRPLSGRVRDLEALDEERRQQVAELRAELGASQYALEQSERTLLEHQQVLEATHAELEKFVRIVDNMHESTSWKVTKPLRTVTAKVQRAQPRPGGSG